MMIVIIMITVMMMVTITTTTTIIIKDESSLRQKKAESMPTVRLPLNRQRISAKTRIFPHRLSIVREIAGSQFSNIHC